MNPILLMFAVLLFMNTSWPMAVFIILAIVLFFAVNLIWRQESILYVPCVVAGMQTPQDNPQGLRSPADKGLAFEDVRMETTDGVKLHAWFMPAKEPKVAPTILFCHANAGNIGLRVPNFAQIVERLECNIFALDYRGYGLSGGTPSEEGLIEDALSAWRWLQAAAQEGRIDGQRVFVFGRSLGGAVAVALGDALQRQESAERPCGLILENTFLSIDILVDDMFPIIAYKPLKERFLRLKWHTVDRIKDLEVPLLFLTGEKDETIPPRHSRDLHAAAARSPLRRQELFSDGMHNDTWEKGGDRYWEVMASYIKECLADGGASRTASDSPG